MQRFLIQVINFSLLFVILVGIPAATHAQLGNWQITSASTARLIIFWGLGLAAGLNLLGAWKLIKDKQTGDCAGNGRPSSARFGWPTSVSCAAGLILNG